VCAPHSRTQTTCAQSQEYNGFIGCKERVPQYINLCDMRARAYTPKYTHKSNVHNNLTHMSIAAKTDKRAYAYPTHYLNMCDILSNVGILWHPSAYARARAHANLDCATKLFATATLSQPCAVCMQKRGTHSNTVCVRMYINTRAHKYAQSYSKTLYV
jgi:hypothetical protein